MSTANQQLTFSQASAKHTYIVTLCKSSSPNSLAVSISHHICFMVNIIKRGIPSEKIGQNIHPPESRFFVINYQHWTSTSAFRPILAPWGHWGGLGGPRGVWGALQTPKMTLLLGGHFRPRNALFWVMTTCLTMFLRFWVKIGPSGPKKGRFWPK